MARTLLLFRHAKSSWDEADSGDFDRPLAPRGRQDAPRIGRELHKRGWLPELALVSSAWRTVETWKLASGELADAPNTEFSRALYHASPDAMLEALRAVPETVGSVILVGHNPGMEELAPQLAGPGSDIEALAALKEKFPTAGLVRFTFDAPWSELGAGSARLTHFLRPKDL